MPRRAGPRPFAALLRLACVAIALWAGAAAAQVEAYVRYKVEITAPRPIEQLLRSDLDLLRWQGYETMTDELLERLVREARTEAAEVLAAQGYFTPRIESRIEAEGVARTVHLEVDPGMPVRVRSVSLRFSGAITQPEANQGATVARIQAQWKLAPGEIFTQAAWQGAKRSAVESVANRRYLLARIAASEAKIDPAGGTAELSMTLDSGPVIAFGELEISGLSKYDEARVRDLWTFAPGADFDQEVIERFQRRLSVVEYFASAYVDVDPARVDGNRVPVRVTVQEAPNKRLQLGVNFSTDAGIGGSAGYQHRNFLGRAWRLGTRLDLQQLVQTGEATIGFPERPGGWADQLALRFRNASIENLDTRDWSLGVRRNSIEERRQPHYGVTLVQSSQSVDGVLDESVHATYLYAGYTRRTTDNLLSPRRGAIMQVEAGIAPPGLSSRGFGRVLARIAWYHPLGSQSDLSVQAQGGAVLAGSSRRIPQLLLFRTGGSTTVRGYDLDSLGVPLGNAIVGGRYFALASVEATHWISDQLGIAAFIDAGNAADAVSDLRPAYGIGAGLRARTPLGPFRLDLAYGEARSSWRLHFSIGLSF